MLQKTDPQTQKILDIASFFENLDPSRYDQKHYCTTFGTRCICGWVNYLNCHMADNHEAAAEYLGLTKTQAFELFSCYVPNATTKQVSKTLRHLAVTGKIDWRV